MLTFIACVIGYAFIGWLTFEFNAWLVRDMVMVDGRTVIRNAVLWPVFLPLLIWSARR
jgi:hypothetical protein